jgi:hypothetical protein
MIVLPGFITFSKFLLLGIRELAPMTLTLAIRKGRALQNLEFWGIFYFLGFFIFC